MPRSYCVFVDLVTILPFEDITIVARVSGRNLRLALENSVSQYPKHEGRFPQVRRNSLEEEKTKIRSILFFLFLRCVG